MAVYPVVCANEKEAIVKFCNQDAKSYMEKVVTPLMEKHRFTNKNTEEEPHYPLTPLR